MDAMSGKKGTAADKRRLRLRNELWPEAEHLVGKADEKGWWRASRLLPLLLCLMRNRKITGKLDCSSVYLELLSRDFGQSFVEIFDEDEHAFCAGYTGDRATRSWRERIIMLENAGFLNVAAKGNRRIGYVLLLNVHAVAEELRKSGKIDDIWWQLYRRRREAVGGTSLEISPEANGDLEEDSGDEE